MTPFLNDVQVCWGPAPPGSRGTLRMNGVGERETRRTGLDRAKSAGERERRKKETRPGICSRVWQLLYLFIYFLVALFFDCSLYTLNWYISKGQTSIQT